MRIDKPRPPHAARPRRRAFTLVEMLVVIGIIALLLGLLLTGLRAAIGTGNKTKELSALRQVYYGWTMYSNSNEEYLLPGYLDDNTQQRWNVEYRDANGDKLAPEFARAWPWRLSSYVDNSWDVLVGYRNDSEKELRAVAPQVVANEPAFGYNAYYVGGWWTAPTVNAPPLAKYDRWIARTAGSLIRPDSQVLFSSSARRDPGFYKANEDDSIPGSHWVSPPIQAMSTIWREGQGGMNNMDVIAPNESVPVNRFGPSVAILTADGGAQSATVGELNDMRRWVNAADKKDWTHAVE